MRLYDAWASRPDFQHLSGVSFYFGDERCVPVDHAESNYGMVMRKLFFLGVPAGCVVHRMEAESADLDAAADRYESVLPPFVDVLLLGVGEDGHIASLFPGSAALRETQRRIIHVVGPKPPPRRLTVTPPVIREARSVFVLAAGDAKADVLERARRAPNEIESLPACMVLGATWLVDGTESELSHNL